MYHLTKPGGLYGGMWISPFLYGIPERRRLSLPGVDGATHVMVDRVGYASCAVCWAMLFSSPDGAAADWEDQAAAEAALAETWLGCIIIIIICGIVWGWLVAERLLQQMYLLHCACY